MPLTLEQYALEYLPQRGLPWPAMPKVEAAKAKPSLPRLPIKAIFWNLYGTLIAIPGGELSYEAQLDFVTDSALEKTIKEFNMWGSMSRKPGAPSAYMKELYRKALDTSRLTGGGSDKFPETHAEKPWEDIIGKLMQKEYKYDAANLGPPSELARKVAYFYHASIQGTGCYDGAATVLQQLADAGIQQGLLADAQCFTWAQLVKGLRVQNESIEPAALLPSNRRFLSYELKARKPSDTLFKAALASAAAFRIKPEEILHIGSNLTRDIAPAKKHGMRTALFAGDKASLSATAEQFKDPALRPDALITSLLQVPDLLGST